MVGRVRRGRRRLEAAAQDLDGRLHEIGAPGVQVGAHDRGGLRDRVRERERLTAPSRPEAVQQPAQAGAVVQVRADQAQIPARPVGGVSLDRRGDGDAPLRLVRQLDRGRLGQRDRGQDRVAPVLAQVAPHAVPHRRHVQDVEPEALGGLEDVDPLAAGRLDQDPRRIGAGPRAGGHGRTGPVGLLEQQHEVPHRPAPREQPLAEVVHQPGNVPAPDVHVPGHDDEGVQDRAGGAVAVLGVRRTRHHGGAHRRAPGVEERGVPHPTGPAPMDRPGQDREFAHAGRARRYAAAGRPTRERLGRAPDEGGRDDQRDGARRPGAGDARTGHR